MKTLLHTITILLIGLLLFSCKNNTDQNPRPNIIMLITDDQGTGDLGCTGNPIIQTPNIDAFHADAVRLTNYHVSTTCAPSRGSIMTGRHTNRINTFHTISGRSILFEDEVLMPQILAQYGYTNGMFGKWHLGDNYPYRPEDRGFDEVVRHGGGGIGQGPDYWGNDYFDDTYWHNGKTQKYKGFCTDVFFNEALKFIEKNKATPFFCYLSTNAPHSPHNLPKEYYEMYADNDNLTEKEKRFYGMITNIDDNFKILEDKLDELKLTDNTILIFTTDNGTASGRQVYNAGLRGQKASEYDGGHRVPFFIRWPNGQLTGGEDINKLTAHYDLLPTFIELLGLDYKTKKPYDGISLVPLLKKKEKVWPKRALYMDTQRLPNLVKYKNYTVMEDEWRLVNGNELYDMSKDRAQTNNIIAEHPEMTKHLKAEYEKWWNSFDADMLNQKHAYIKVGSKYENPSRLSAHDMYTAQYGTIWHQNGAITASRSSGVWKIEFIEDGEYSISLCRFPRESGLTINTTFPEVPKTVEIENTKPGSTKADFDMAYLYVAGIGKKIKIKEGQKEVRIKGFVPAGKYDMEAQLIDKEGRVHPAYYVYIEKL